MGNVRNGWNADIAKERLRSDQRSVLEGSGLVTVWPASNTINQIKAMMYNKLLKKIEKNSVMSG